MKRTQFQRGVVLGCLITLACVVGLTVTDSVFAATRVNVMPNRQVRPGTTTPVWGNAGNLGAVGDGSANGEAYSWSFSANPNVTVTHDGSLSGVVADDHFIVENVSFALGGGSTREIITATLTVGGTSKSTSIDIVSAANSISDTPLENLAVDVNISIQDGLRAMYLAQASNGSWPHGVGGGVETCGTTAFTIWAFANSGHQPTNDINTDIYAEWVQRAINFILAGATTPAFVPQVNIGSPDGDGNGRIINLCPGGAEGYASPIAAAALIAAHSGTPLTTVPIGAFVGETYKQVVQDAIDWIAFAQSELGAPAQGGWRYTANYPVGSDTSVDSWHYVAMEGFEAVFAGTALEAVKREAERRINSSQSQAGGTLGQFGYDGAIHFNSADANATTAGGLSGLVMISRGGRVGFHLDPGGSLVTGTFPDVVSRKTAAVAWLGSVWDRPPGVWAGNHGNFYAMWTTARALRLNITGILVKSGVTFDWETGEESGSGNVPGPGATREGYFAFLVRTQAAGGHWAATVNTGSWTQNLNTAWGILVLQPTVFGPPGLMCNGKLATIYVKDGKIVGGPDAGQTYLGSLRGTPGPDVMVGTDGSDLIKGFDGDDTICGGDGDDRIEGGAGDDWIDGGKGNDLIKGQFGNDTLFGGEGNDRIEGGPGNDTLDGGPGSNILNGETGTDTCVSGPTFISCP